MQLLTGCGLFGQKGVGLLRQGAGSSAQALLLRFGPSLNARTSRRPQPQLLRPRLRADLRHRLRAGQHPHAGRLGAPNRQPQFGRRQRTLPRQGGGGSGGSLHLFADLPGLKLIEASSESSYAGQGVTLYRRTLALIGGPAGGYALDLFRVKGGSQHDYLFHALADRASVDRRRSRRGGTRLARRGRHFLGRAATQRRRHGRPPQPALLEPAAGQRLRLPHPAPARPGGRRVERPMAGGRHQRCSPAHGRATGH